MKTRISALMDGELDDHEIRDAFRFMRSNATERLEWDRFHLIGDALRGERRLEIDLVSRVMDDLDAEPTVLAPPVRQQIDRFRPVLALAASAAGVAVVAWVALGSPHQSYIEPVSRLAPIAAAPVPDADAAGMGMRSASPEKLQEYLVAHHAHSSMSAMTTGTHFVRTVSMERSSP